MKIPKKLLSNSRGRAALLAILVVVLAVPFITGAVRLNLEADAMSLTAEAAPAEDAAKGAEAKALQQSLTAEATAAADEKGESSTEAGIVKTAAQVYAVPAQVTSAAEDDSQTADTAAEPEVNEAEPAEEADEAPEAEASETADKAAPEEAEPAREEAGDEDTAEADEAPAAEEAQEEPAVTNTPVNTGADYGTSTQYVYSFDELTYHGCFYWGGWRWTYYSEEVLPGPGLYALNENGRCVREWIDGRWQQVVQTIEVPEEVEVEKEISVPITMAVRELTENGGYRTELQTRYVTVTMPATETVYHTETLYLQENGFITDGDGYIALASQNYPKGTILPTPFGVDGKVYDWCGVSGTVDVYVHF